MHYAIAAVAGALAVRVGHALESKAILIVTFVPPLTAVVTFVVLHKIEEVLMRDSRDTALVSSQQEFQNSGWCPYRSKPGTETPAEPRKA